MPYKYYRFFSQIRHLRNSKTLSSWMESQDSRESTLGGRPIPWVTYPALEFLQGIDLHKYQALEVGSGASTTWLSMRCKKVVSYEFDEQFFLKSRRLLIDRGVDYRLVCSTLDMDILSIDPVYFETVSFEMLHSGVDKKLLKMSVVSKYISDFKKDLENSQFVFIDGGFRVLSMQLVAQYLGDNAIIVIDNADRDYERHGIRFLLDSGWVEFPFVGIGPLNAYEWKTSVFVKSLRFFRL